MQSGLCNLERHLCIPERESWNTDKYFWITQSQYWNDHSFSHDRNPFVRISKGAFVFTISIPRDL